MGAGSVFCAVRNKLEDDMSKTQASIPQGRIASIDALRGFSMFWILQGEAMFIAMFGLHSNSVANEIVRQLHHSKWTGFTFYDLIAPLFLFAVGLSMPFSISKRLERGHNRQDLWKHIIRRTIVLFLLGFVFNDILEFNFLDFRIMGVLQRIALCYGIAAVIVMTNSIRGQIVWMVGLLMFDWGIMTLVPVPGIGAGVLTPEGNLAGYIDRLLLPGKLCCYGFGDNEGLLTTLSCTTATTFGAICGHYLRTSVDSMERKTFNFVWWGVALIVVGMLWNLVYPINRLLWSASYMTYANGWSVLLFGVFYWIIDVKGYKKWAFPFIIIGMNAITIYVLQSQFDFGHIANIFIRGIAPLFGDFERPFYLLCVIIVKILFLYFLYRQRIFLKV